MIVSFTCFRAEPIWYSISFGDEFFDPVNLIFFSSMYLSVQTSAHVFHSASLTLDHALWLTFGLGLLIAASAHLIWFLVASGRAFYLVMVVMIFAVIGGEYCEITMKLLTAPVLYVGPPQKTDKPN